MPGIPFLPQPVDTYSAKKFHFNLRLPATGSPRLRHPNPVFVSLPLHFALRPRCLKKMQTLDRNHVARLHLVSDERAKITRETKTAVNRFANRPMVSVTAKPLTGPVPNMNRIAAETMRGHGVSTIVTHACATLVHRGRGRLARLTSSRMRLEDQHVESTAIPMVRMTPAMPGRVSVKVIPPLPADCASTLESPMTPRRISRLRNRPGRR